jgi:hypothetical protein
MFLADCFATCLASTWSNSPGPDAQAAEQRPIGDLISRAADASVARGCMMDERTGDPPRETALTSVRGSAGAAEFKPQKDHVPRGIGCMVLATMMFSTASALTKWQVGLYPAGEVVFSRSGATCLRRAC